MVVGNPSWSGGVTPLFLVGVLPQIFGQRGAMSHGPGSTEDTHGERPSQTGCLPPYLPGLIKAEYEVQVGHPVKWEHELATVLTRDVSPPSKGLPRNVALGAIGPQGHLNDRFQRCEHHASPD